MRHRHQRWQIEGSAGTIDPCPIAAQRTAQSGFVTDRTGKIGVIARKPRVLLEHACGHRGPCATVATGNVAPVNEPQPIEDPLIPVSPIRAARVHEASQIRPGRKTVLTGHAGLRVVQAQAQLSERFIVFAGGGRQRVAKPGEGVDIAASIGGKQVLRLPLQLVEIRPVGESLHINLRAWSADDPQLRLHKGYGASSRGKWALPFPRVRMRPAPRHGCYGDRKGPSISARGHHLSGGPVSATAALPRRGKLAKAPTS